MPKQQTLPESWPSKNPAEWLRRIAQVVNKLLLGETNNVGNVTLTASATTTTITDRRVTPETMASLEPLTAAAVTARATLRQAAGAGSLVLTHASNAATDQNFRYALWG